MRMPGGGPDALRFTVRRAGGTHGGEVSHHLHDHVREADTLRVGVPCGDVVLDEGEGPVLLVSAGIGCTPKISMLGHLAATGTRRHVVAVHDDRAPSTHAFRADLDQFVRKLPHATAHVWHEDPEGPWPAERTGRVDLTTVPLPEDATAYLCGPLPFLRAVRNQLLGLGVPATAIHYEVFGPDLWLGQE